MLVPFSQMWCLSKPDIDGFFCLAKFYKLSIKKVKDRLSFTFLHYVTFSPSRSVRCETKKPPAMRVRIEGYTKKTPNAIQLRCSSQL